jgi:hypothetical protein
MEFVCEKRPPSVSITVTKAAESAVPLKTLSTIETEVKAASAKLHPRFANPAGSVRLKKLLSGGSLCHIFFSAVKQTQQMQSPKMHSRASHSLNKQSLK